MLKALFFSSSDAMVFFSSSVRLSCLLLLKVKQTRVFEHKKKIRIKTHRSLFIFCARPGIVFVYLLFSVLDFIYPFSAIRMKLVMRKRCSNFTCSTFSSSGEFCCFFVLLQNIAIRFNAETQKKANIHVVLHFNFLL